MPQSQLMLLTDWAWAEVRLDPPSVEWVSGLRLYPLLAGVLDDQRAIW